MCILSTKRRLLFTAKQLILTDPVTTAISSLQRETVIMEEDEGDEDSEDAAQGHNNNQVSSNRNSTDETDYDFKLVKFSNDERTKDTFNDKGDFDSEKIGAMTGKEKKTKRLTPMVKLGQKLKGEYIVKI